MKLVCVWLLAYFAYSESKLLPQNLPTFCPRSHEDYVSCTKNVLRKLGPHLVKGVREINFPPLNPLQIPLFIVNRTFNENLRMDSVLKNVKLLGFKATELKDFKFDPETLNGELHIFAPRIHYNADINISGQVHVMRLKFEGNSFGNFSNIDFLFKFSLIPVERLGVEYYTTDKFEVKSDIGSIEAHLNSKTPEAQAFNEFNQRLFNSNPKIFIEASKPVWEASLEVFFRQLIDRTLSAIPAEELIPA